MGLTIDNENLFKQAITDGVNLFVGAGFSLLAKDADGKQLPLGGELNEELRTHFGKNSILPLPQLCTILEKSNKEAFHNYLKNRFSVKYIDTRYYFINKLNIKNIFTTNIDNLIPRIIENGSKYINDQIANGPSNDENAVNYTPLHGNVERNDSQYVFDVSSIANVHNETPRIWSCLSLSMETFPTIFLGYSFNDSSVIQTLTSRQTFGNAQKPKWILLLDSAPDYIEYYESLGFNIIRGDIASLLEYFGKIEYEVNDENKSDSIDMMLKMNIVPHSIYEIDRHRPIKDFYTGSSPIWSDILDNQIYKTHHLPNILDSIYSSKRGTIIIGAPVTGKSTLMMQAANEIKNLGTKLHFESISENKAIFLKKIIGDQKVVIFIDDIYESVEALPILDQNNIKIVGAERSHNYSIISHLIDKNKYNIINVTSLTDKDTQGIYDSLPESIRGNILRREEELGEYGKDTLFEFVIRNIKGPSIKERYAQAIKQIEINDPDLAEFLVLCAYMHSCRIPLSSEMAHAYFDGYYNYDDIFEMQDDAKDIIHEYIPKSNDDEYKEMAYYYPRSRYIADVIKNSCSRELLKSVISTVIEKIPSYIICNYKTFRKYAFDKIIAERAFDDWHEGKEYYENAFIYDRRNPYVLQQGALYLAGKNRYEEAFSWIDKAISLTDDKYFSIRNTHAIILFNANIRKNGANVRNELDASMKILEKCMRADSRKRFHAHTYGRQAIEYHNRFHDEYSVKYLNQALQWLNDEIDQSAWDHETRRIKEKIMDILK